MCRPGWRQAREEAYRLAELARLRRVRDRIDREYAQPLDVVALARDAGLAAGYLSRQFRAAYGDSPYGYLTRRRAERAAASASAAASVSASLPAGQDRSGFEKPRPVPGS
ncbi:Transcriptional regulator [Kitasatospora sp. MMS16-BH015]|uniref:helix-turn-helix domain-containing protein n=1 Tax=Kitasatospora sp. MMS16-BH015 TaxID=2018025 RepID=UPI000CA3660E|nr:Transcriptional regulator [Kitasatospora sp. MMS16-BH015]